MVSFFGFYNSEKFQNPICQILNFYTPTVFYFTSTFTLSTLGNFIGHLRSQIDCPDNWISG